MNKIFETYNSLHNRTKAVLIFCCVYILLTATCAAVCYIGAGTLFGSYSAFYLANDFITATKSCIGITAFGAVMIEYASKNG